MNHVTHEDFIAGVAEIVVRHAPQHAKAIAAVKIAYGSGPDGTRGVTFYGAWQNGEPEAIPFVEISAFGEQGWVQIAGTCIHELAHVVGGFDAGHGREWRDYCAELGLRRAKAAGMDYCLGHFAPAVRRQIVELPKPDDGAPVRKLINRFGRPFTLKPCTAGVGTRGGKSRGAGSGSRQLKVVCQHEDCGYLARVTRKWLDAAGAPICPVEGHGQMGRAD